MKRVVLTILLFCLVLISASAQISLGTNDFSHANDTIRVSTALPFSGMDAAATGANYNWDYSLLSTTYSGQTIDTLLSVNSLPNYLNFYFLNITGNPNRCNQATFTSTSILGLLGIPVNGTYDMFYNSSSSFLQRGIGLATDTIAAPVAYTSPDIVYKFPLAYNNLDSSTSGLIIDLIPGLYYSAFKTRINTVDGWGTLTTPYGTFPVLRMQSVIHEHDSISFDSLGINFGIDLPEVIEYKWLGTAQKIPLLQINTTLGVPSSIVYRDSVRMLISVPEVNTPAFNFEVFPNPSINNISVKYILAQTAEVSFDILNLEGKIIYSEKPDWKNSGEQTHSIKTLNFAAGNYFLRMSVLGKHYSQPLIITR